LIFSVYYSIINNILFSSYKTPNIEITEYE
jgi:hypothetical protein